MINQRSGLAEAPLTEMTEESPRESSGVVEQRNRRVVIHGLRYFCRMLPGAFQSDGWELRHHDGASLPTLIKLLRDLRRADLLFVWGARISFGKFLRAARIFNKKNIVLFWSGSDVLGAQMQFAEGKLEPWIADKIHWAAAPWLRDEIQAIGLKCEYVPINWVAAVERPQPLPERFSVLVYVPSVVKGALYGLDRVLRVARTLPHIPFELVGLTDGQIADAPPNLRIRGRIQGMSELYRQTSVYWRPVSHDGFPFTVLEALSHGRHVVWSYPFPHCLQSTSAEADLAEITKLHTLHGQKLLGLNEPGMQMVSERFSAESIKRDYLRRWEEIIVSSTDPS